MKVIAIDPGDKHVGWAVFIDGECTYVAEIEPDQVPDMMFAGGSDPDVVVCEEFRLYPWSMQAQRFSQMATCELIGVIKYLCATEVVSLVMQPATIKKVARAQMSARGSVNDAVKLRKGGHAADAFLHGWYWLMKTVIESESK